MSKRMGRLTKDKFAEIVNEHLPHLHAETSDTFRVGRIVGRLRMDKGYTVHQVGAGTKGWTKDRSDDPNYFFWNDLNGSEIDAWLFLLTRGINPQYYGFAPPSKPTRFGRSEFEELNKKLRVSPVVEERML